MKTHFLMPSPYNKLWELYANGGYAKGTGCKGFGRFLEKTIPGVCVTGTTGEGHVLRFENDKDYTWFRLKWL